MPKYGKWDITESELDSQIAEAKRLGEIESASEPLAVSAAFSARTRTVAVEMKSGVVVTIPVALLQGLGDATMKQLRNVEVMGGGYALRWPDIDADFQISALLKGIFGTGRWMSELGKHGGLARSTRKTQAARENGKKGGRPARTTASSSRKLVAAK